MVGKVDIFFNTARHPSSSKSPIVIPKVALLTEGLAESVVGAEGAPRAFILKLGYFGLIL